MKKILSAVIVTASFIACSQNENKEQSTTTESTTTTNGGSEADRRAKEIADSTSMLDKKLADPNDPTTPDSLK